MISLLDLLDHVRLARAVIRLDRQNTTLRKLAALEEDRADELATQLELAQDTIEAMRAEISTRPAYTPGIELEGSRSGAVRDAATLENRVLSTVEGWAADAERTARAQLNRAEVELTNLRARAAAWEARSRELETEVEALRRASAAVPALRAEVASLRRDLSQERDYAYGREQALMADRDAALRRATKAEANIDTRDDAPPPTQPSARRPAPPSPPRFRAGGEP